MSAALDVSNLKKKAFKGVFTLTFRRLILKVIDTVGMIFLARKLSQSAFGTFGIVTFIVFTFLQFFSDIGFGAALIQKKEELTKEDTQTTFTIQQILVTILLVASWFLAPVITGFYDLGVKGVWLIRVLSLSLFATSFKTIPSIILERQLKFEKLIIPEIIETLIYNGIAVYLAYQGYGVWSLVVAIVVRTFAGAIALNLLQPWKIGWNFNKEAAHELLHFGVPYQLNSGLALIKDNVTPTLIAYLYGPAAVGYVNLAQNIASRPMEIINIVSRVSFPAYSRIQHNTKRLKRWLEKSVRLMSIGYFPAIAGLLVIAPEILRYLYANKTDKWLPALATLLFFLAVAFPVIISTTYTNALYALGKPKIVLYFMIIYTVLTWGLGAPLILQFGYVGIAIAGMIITYATLPFVIYHTRKVVPVETFKSLKKPAFASIIMAATVYLVNMTITNSLSTLIITILIGVITYLAVLYAIEGEYLRTEVLSWLKMLGRDRTKNAK